MPEPTHVRPTDARGVSRMAIDATIGITDLVEAMHSTILRLPRIFGAPVTSPTGGITGLVYNSVRTITALVGGGIDLALAPLASLLRERSSSPERDAVIAALNGVLGDYLEDSGNPLAIRMCLRIDGRAVELTRPALAEAIPQPSDKILLLAHGLCLTDQHWEHEGHDHGALLAEELGYTPVYLHYNSGRHISTNGRELADMLAALSEAWPVPVEGLAIIAHSMGGLVARSACHYGARAGHAWPGQLRTLIFLGTPHHGSPLERAGNWLDALLLASPYTAAFARLGQIRSAGITDLRYGSLLDEDWAGRDRFTHAGDPRQTVPLPEGVACYTVAATTGSIEGDLDPLGSDGLVPLDSALGAHQDPDVELPLRERWVGYDMNHMQLLHRRDVYAQLRQWLAG
ncbi:GPI inositol-deacylase [Oscillochloris sp. ZM17-4]|uniref:lipase family alpha/beta hydrolase n=1 Tax=Oscillochloris sp. ZM17-4 TaxID=2866714 RepID=UPI001C7305A8|nr:GPI inositol-deacylase [Oscillochloris sp. ZM17-4]MBX0328457.1 GPI inositol-deacylase [Oscillochloris sp. ZM17-4]